MAKSRNHNHRARSNQKIIHKMCKIKHRNKYEKSFYFQRLIKSTKHIVFHGWQQFKWHRVKLLKDPSELTCIYPISCSHANVLSLTVFKMRLLYTSPMRCSTSPSPDQHKCRWCFCLFSISSLCNLHIIDLSFYLLDMTLIVKQALSIFLVELDCQDIRHHVHSISSCIHLHFVCSNPSRLLAIQLRYA